MDTTGDDPIPPKAESRSLRDPEVEAAAAAAFALLPPAEPPPALDTDELRADWAVRVADEFVEILNRRADADPVHTFVIDECWIGQPDLALYVRYSGTWGLRMADLHRDFTGDAPARNIRAQALAICDDMQGAELPEYTDPAGHEWFGQDPEDATWQWSVDEQPRLHTAWPPITDPVERVRAVAAALLRLAGSAQTTRPHDPSIDECWVGEDLGLYVRYRYAGELRGYRAGAVDDGRVRPEFVPHPHNLANQLWHELGTDVSSDYVDERGYAWSGAAPDATVTWAFVIERMPRIRGNPG